MDDPQCRITVFHRLNDNTNGKEIVDLIDGLMLIDHLAINAEEMLGTSLNVRLDSCVDNVLAHFLYQAVDISLAFLLAQCHLLHQIIVSLWLQILQGQIIQFDLNLGDTQPLCQRGINLHRLLGFFLLLLRCHILQGTHIVQPVCQLNQNDTDVLRHGQKHLA